MIGPWLNWGKSFAKLLGCVHVQPGYQLQVATEDGGQITVVIGNCRYDGTTGGDTMVIGESAVVVRYRDLLAASR
jgi:hypothetical protein